VVKKYPISSYSAAKKLPKIAEVKLSSCGLQKKLRLRNCGVAVVEQHFFKSCGIAIAEVLPASCGIAIADSKKSCACPPLVIITESIDSLVMNSLGSQPKFVFQKLASAKYIRTSRLPCD
jgi:hypothetical protein